MAKLEKLENLKNDSPAYLITCQYCNGTQKTITICNRCNGTGIMDMPGNNATSLSMVFSCVSCYGSGYEQCKMCIGGKMADPDYNAKCGILSGNVGGNAGAIYIDPDWNLETKKTDCVKCKGSGSDI